MPIRDRHGRPVPAWSAAAPTSIIATLGDDWDHATAERARIGLVARSAVDRGLIGGTWFLDRDRDDLQVGPADPGTDRPTTALATTGLPTARSTLTATSGRETAAAGITGRGEHERRVRNATHDLSTILPVSRSIRSGVPLSTTPRMWVVRSAPNPASRRSSHLAHGIGESNLHVVAVVIEEPGPADQASVDGRARDQPDPGALGGGVPIVAERRDHRCRCGGAPRRDGPAVNITRQLIGDAVLRRQSTGPDCREDRGRVDRQEPVVPVNVQAPCRS